MCSPNELHFVWFGIVAATVLLAAPIADGAPAKPAQFDAVFRLAFDGTAQAMAHGANPAVAGADALTFAEGKLGQAADFTKGACVEYRNLPMPDPKEGTLELWIKSCHDAKDMQDDYFLRFLREDGSPAIEVQFYHVEMSAQVKMYGKRNSRRYAWGWAKDAWQHIVVAWDASGEKSADLMLYRNGLESGHATRYRPFHAAACLRVGCYAPQDKPARALIDEVTLYNQCLTPSQVKLLYESGGKRFEDKLAALRQRIAQDDARRERQHHLLFDVKKLAIIHGRNTSLLHWKKSTFKRLGLPVFTPVHETEVATTDMSQFDAVMVPGGGGLNLDAANRDALQAFVRQGGGYVGICGGAVSAARAGLIDAKRYTFDVRGPVYDTLKEHPITQGYDVKRKLLMPHASGPLFVIGEGSDETPVILFNVGGGDLPVFVDCIAKHYGKGRVAVFSSHPEGSPRTYALLRNAIMWVAKIIEPEDAPQPKQ